MSRLPSLKAVLRPWPVNFIFCILLPLQSTIFRCSRSRGKEGRILAGTAFLLAFRITVMVGNSFIYSYWCWKQIKFKQGFKNDHSPSSSEQGGRLSLGLGGRKFTVSALQSASARPSSRPAPAVAAASSRLTWRKHPAPPGGRGGGVTSSQTPVRPWLRRSPSWTSVHPAAVSPRNKTLPPHVCFSAFLANLMCFCAQPRERQPTGGWGSFWVRELSGGSSCVTTPILDGNWQLNKFSLIQRVPRRARYVHSSIEYIKYSGRKMERRGKKKKTLNNSMNHCFGWKCGSRCYVIVLWSLFYFLKCLVDL